MSIPGRRLKPRLIGYWETIKDAETYPDIMQFNTGAVEDVWPQCVRLSVEAAEREAYRCEYMGEAVKAASGRDLTGQVIEFGDVRFPGNKLYHTLRDAITGKPAEQNGHFLKENGAMVKYDACLLPFGNARDGVTHIIVGLACRSL